MKLLHTSDLHIGKRVNGFSMLPDQEYILDRILEVAETEKPDAVLIAGDIYDKTQPPGEAVRLLDEFLTALLERVGAVFLISGNHDSPERLGFGSRIMKNRGLHIAGVFDGSLQMVGLTDEYGPVNVYLLPFIKPATAAPFLESAPESYDDAVRAVIQAAEVNAGERNVLAAHQFITSGGQEPERSESENLSIGGVDNVDASAFDAFDYVALGHLHGPQRIGRDTVRYAGSPLKYSFSEATQKKAVTLVEMGAKGSVSVRQIPLRPLRDMRRIKGPLEELICAAKGQDRAVERVFVYGADSGSGQQKSEWAEIVGADADAENGVASDAAGMQLSMFGEAASSICAATETETGAEAGDPQAENQDYIGAVLTDEEEPYDAIGRLRSVYPNLMSLEFENSRTRAGGGLIVTGGADVERKGPEELFADFYEQQNGEEMNREQNRILKDILEQGGGVL